ncbi:MAG: DUF1949 domain-containing protein, partial [bacterium]|nr:DUF1949 domain-containing protein [bacterium]
AFDYNLTGNVMRVISQFNGVVIQSSYDALVKIEVSVRLSVVDKFKTNLVDVTSGKISIIQDD